MDSLSKQGLEEKRDKCFDGEWQGNDLETIIIISTITEITIVPITPS